MDTWPINKSALSKPPNWTGWPEGKKFALILTHDVETKKGHDKCKQLIELEKRIGFKSSYNFVPERYNVSSSIRNHITDNGFEVGVHGLLHDGKLFKSHKIFLQRAIKINNYIKLWNASGFRAPAMHHDLDLFHELNIIYDSSTFDTDPFEPQHDGVNTIFPFLVNSKKNKRSYVELPYTLPQDSTLFILMKYKDIEIWKKKLDWIAKNGGMALLITHPDYMNFNNYNINFDEYLAKYYEHFLEYIKTTYEGSYWHVLPKQAAGYFLDKYNCIHSINQDKFSSLI